MKNSLVLPPGVVVKKLPPGPVYGPKITVRSTASFGAFTMSSDEDGYSLFGSAKTCGHRPRLDEIEERMGREKPKKENPWHTRKA